MKLAREKGGSPYGREVEYEDEGMPVSPAPVFDQIAQRGLKRILEWEKALGEGSNRTLKR
jgi:hypothetical protein